MKKFKEFREDKLNEELLVESLSPTDMALAATGIIGVVALGVAILPTALGVANVAVSAAIDKVSSWVKGATGGKVPGYKEALKASFENKEAFKKYASELTKNPKVVSLIKKIIDAHNTGLSTGYKELEELKDIVGRELGPEKTKEIIKMAFVKKK